MSLSQKLAALVLGGCLAVAPAMALAAGSEPPKTEPTPGLNERPGATPKTPEEKAALARKEAEALYQAGWQDVEKARAEAKEAAELKAGSDSVEASQRAERTLKADKLRQSGQKRLKKALDKFRQATDLAPDYHEAWNMQGYCYRKTGQLGSAGAAYRTCLKLKPDYAEAHEYLAELALLTGNLKKAQEELAWLHQAERKDLAARLAAAIDRRTAGADSAGLQASDW